MPGQIKAGQGSTSTYGVVQRLDDALKIKRGFSLPRHTVVRSSWRHALEGRFKGRGWSNRARARIHPRQVAKMRDADLEARSGSSIYSWFNDRVVCLWMGHWDWPLRDRGTVQSSEKAPCIATGVSS